MKKSKISEAGLNVSGNGRAYPPYGNILILSGGAGYGKSFVAKNVLLFDGKSFNVDDLKEKFITLAKKKPNCMFAQKFYKETGYKLQDLDLSDSRQTYTLHKFISELNVPMREQAAFFLAAATSKDKPNAIFDITLKEMSKLKEVSDYAEVGGYDKKNIHIVWILTHIEEAKVNNMTRQRTVPENIFVQTHEGAKMTMLEFINNSQKYTQYMDGDIWVVFNRQGIDSNVLFTLSGGLSGKDKKKIAHISPEVGKLAGMNRKTRGYLAVHIKEAGKPAKKLRDIDADFREKILGYTPK